MTASRRPPAPADSRSGRVRAVVYLAPELLAACGVAAERAGLSRSSVIEFALGLGFPDAERALAADAASRAKAAMRQALAEVPGSAPADLPLGPEPEDPVLSSSSLVPLPPDPVPRLAAYARRMLALRPDLGRPGLAVLVEARAAVERVPQRDLADVARDVVAAALPEPPAFDSVPASAPAPVAPQALAPDDSGPVQSFTRMLRVWVTPRVFARLETVARELRITRSWLVRQALAVGVPSVVNDIRLRRRAGSRPAGVATRPRVTAPRRGPRNDDPERDGWLAPRDPAETDPVLAEFGPDYEEEAAEPRRR